MAFRSHLNVKLQSELLGQVINDGQMVVVPGTSTWGDTIVKFYYYDVNSSAIDDGENVIKPTSVLGDGRYIKLTNTQWVGDWSQSNSASLDYIKNKPTIPSAQVNSDWNSISGLSQILNKPSSFAPSGNAGGDLVGTYPNPTLASVTTAATGGIVTFNAKGQVTSVKKQELFTGTTNGSGNVTFTYSGTYGATPNVQYNLGNGASNKESIVVTAKSSTSVTVLVQLRTDIAGLLPTYAAVSGREVDFIVTEK